MAAKLISQEQLQRRYEPFAAKDGTLFSKRALYRWRREEGFPEPIIKTPRLIWVLDDVIAWEVTKNYTFLHDSPNHIEVCEV